MSWQFMSGPADCQAPTSEQHKPVCWKQRQIKDAAVLLRRETKRRHIEAYLSAAEDANTADLQQDESVKSEQQP